MVNAGIGAFPGKDKKHNLKQEFHALLQNGLPGCMAFLPATPHDTWLGQAVPCGNTPYRLCGERILLTGDAAGLVQAATGEGIGHAVVSGILAGRVAMDALKDGNQQPTQATLEALYARPLMKRIEQTLRRQHLIVATATRMPWLVGGMIELARRSEWVARRLRSI
jgi:flavin-dependent dehydrogenase